MKYTETAGLNVWNANCKYELRDSIPIPQLCTSTVKRIKGARISMPLHECKLKFAHRLRDPILPSGLHFLIEADSEAGKEHERKLTEWSWCDPRRSLSSGNEVQARECLTWRPYQRTSNPPVLPARDRRVWLGVREMVLSPQSRAMGWPTMDWLHMPMGTLSTRWCLHKSHCNFFGQRKILHCLQVIFRLKHLKQRYKSAGQCGLRLQTERKEWKVLLDLMSKAVI